MTSEEYKVFRQWDIHKCTENSKDGDQKKIHLLYVDICKRAHTRREWKIQALYSTQISHQPKHRLSPMSTSIMPQPANRQYHQSWLDQDQTHPARSTKPRVMTGSTEMSLSWFIADLTGTPGTTKTQVQAVRRGEGDWTGSEQMLHPHVVVTVVY